jgi:hypothetical protein
MTDPPVDPPRGDAEPLALPRRPAPPVPPEHRTIVLQASIAAIFLLLVRRGVASSEEVDGMLTELETGMLAAFGDVRYHHNHPRLSGLGSSVRQIIGAWRAQLTRMA